MFSLLATIMIRLLVRNNGRKLLTKSRCQWFSEKRDKSKDFSIVFLSSLSYDRKYLQALLAMQIALRQIKFSRFCIKCLLHQSNVGVTSMDTCFFCWQEQLPAALKSVALVTKREARLLFGSVQAQPCFFSFNPFLTISRASVLPFIYSRPLQSASGHMFNTF